MIKKIEVCNRFHIDLVSSNIRKMPYDYWHLISISCPDTPQKKLSLINDKTRGVLESQGCNKILSLQFDDLRDDQEELCIKHGYKITLFTKEQAKEVVTFLDDIHKESKNSCLVIHCDAGISRSGAIAQFTSDYFKIKFSQPYICPNKFVLRLLWEVIDGRKENNIVI